MNTRYALLALWLATPSVAQTTPPPSGVKLTVVPFAAISGDVPSRAGTKAAAMLATEIRNTESLTVVDAKRDAPADPHQASLEQARKLFAEAKQHREKRKFRLAEEALQKAVAAYHAGAPGLSDVGELVDAYALLSAVQYLTGRDEDGQKTLATALAFAPDRELPLQKTSALFSRVVEDVRKRVKDGPKGTLLVESIPPGAAVSVDGVPLGSTPLQVKDVPAGQHVWRVALPSGEVTGGVVEVGSGKTSKVLAQTTAKDPESRIVAALSQNRIDNDVLAALKELAGAAQADVVLFGALSKEGKGLALDAFLFSTQSAELKRLPRAQFDTELLSAGVEFYALAGKLAQNGARLGDATKVPGQAVIGASAGTRVVEAKYGVKAGEEPSDVETEPMKDEGGQRPLEKKRTPLKKR